MDVRKQKDAKRDVRGKHRGARGEKKWRTGEQSLTDEGGVEGECRQRE